MLNNTVRWEQFCNFLWLYKRSYDENFTEKEELLKASQEIAKIEDEEYQKFPALIKRIVDAAYLYEFDMILKGTHPSNNDEEFEKFWVSRITKKVSQIKKPMNNKQRELVRKAKIYMAKQKSKDFWD